MFDHEVPLKLLNYIDHLRAARFSEIHTRLQNLWMHFLISTFLLLTFVLNFVFQNWRVWPLKSVWRSSLLLIDQVTKWMTNWLIGWLSDPFPDWLTHWLRLTDCLTVWLTDCLFTIYYYCLLNLTSYTLHFYTHRFAISTFK